MPSVSQNANTLMLLYYKEAPVLHREMIKEVVQAYRNNKIKNFDKVENVVLKLASRSKGMTKGGKGAQAYLDLMNEYGLLEKPKPQRETKLERMERRVEELKEGKPKRTRRLVSVILYTTPDLEDRAKGPAKPELDKDEQRNFKRYLNKRWRGLHQFWKGQLDVKGPGDDFWNALQHQLIRKQEKHWRQLFKACLTDYAFRTRELAAPGYIEAIYVLDSEAVAAPARRRAAAVDPAETEKRMAGQKLTIDYRYSWT